jgi:formylmethanofuran dehydrogenase subunit C
MSGLAGRLKTELDQRADFGEVFAPSWSGLGAGELERRPVYLERDGPVSLGDLFSLTGTPDGSIRLVGDLSRVDRLGAGLAEGTITVEGDVGAQAGVAMIGGVLEIEGNAGPRAGAAPPGYKRGMAGGELVVHGACGEESGAAMRRGTLAIGKAAGDRTGLGMIAGTVIVFGAAGRDSGLWSKRGSVVALGKIEPPATYAYACTYQPVYLRFMLGRLRARFRLPVQRKHLAGYYRRYSGDLAELGRGEILVWTAQ